MVPVIVGEDWQAVLLWKALFEAGVYTNVALHPAVPPGGALLRTSLMATHERDQLDRALEIFADVIKGVSRTCRPGKRRGSPDSIADCDRRGRSTLWMDGRSRLRQNICS